MVKIAILLPVSFGIQERDRKIFSYTVGCVARACSIFRVNKIIIYRDHTSENFDTATIKQHGKSVRDLLEYANLPQYLRKYLPKRQTFRYVGVLPPLRAIYHHPAQNEYRAYRYGYLKKVSKSGYIVDLGLQKLFFYPTKTTTTTTDKIAIFKLTGETTCTKVAKSEIPYFFGYDVELWYNQNLRAVVEKLRTDGYLLIGASKYGECITKTAAKLKTALLQNNKDGVGIAFGSYSECFFEWFDETELHAMFDFIINTIPDQGTKTIRTEEAIFGTLAILNALIIT